MHCRRITLIVFYLIGATLRGLSGGGIACRGKALSYAGSPRDSMAVFWGEVALCRPGVGS
jgi:hypothetical protein